MLKPIPNEQTTISSKGRKNPSSKKNKNFAIDRKKSLEANEGKNILTLVAHQLGQYVSHAKKYSEKEMKSLINGLHRSVLYLQKQRRSSVDQKQKNQRKK